MRSWPSWACAARRLWPAAGRRRLAFLVRSSSSTSRTASGRALHAVCCAKNFPTFPASSPHVLAVGGTLWSGPGGAAAPVAWTSGRLGLLVALPDACAPAGHRCALPRRQRRPPRIPALRRLRRQAAAPTQTSRRSPTTCPWWTTGDSSPPAEPPAPPHPRSRVSSPSSTTIASPPASPRSASSTRASTRSWDAAHTPRSPLRQTSPSATPVVPSTLAAARASPPTAAGMPSPASDRPSSRASSRPSARSELFQVPATWAGRHRWLL